nr:hypothetical protein [Tanacetum cinerariifolium]
DEEDKEEECSDMRVHTPSHFESTDDDAYDEVTQGENIEEEKLDEETYEEEEVNEMYNDLNNRVLMYSGFISKILNPNPDTGESILNLNIKSTSLVDVSVTTNDEIHPSPVTTLPPPPIPLIQPVQQTYVSTPTIAPSTSLQSLPTFGSLFKFEDRVKYLEDDFSEFKQTNLFAKAVSSILDEAKAENEDFINKIDENIKKIIKEQVKVQVKEQVSKILPRIEKDIVSLKRRQDDKNEDDEPFTGSNRGSKRRKAGKEHESTSAPKDKTFKSTGSSKEGSKSKTRSTGKSAQAEEQVHTIEDLEEPAYQEFKTDKKNRLMRIDELRQFSDSTLNDVRSALDDILKRIRMEESARDVYSIHRIIAITKLTIVEWHNYKHLDWITICRDEEKLYRFNECDYKRLRLLDIKDTLFLLVQGKLKNLTIEECSLVGKLMSSSIMYGRCRAFEQVASMKEPFDLSKVKGYRSSYKKDHTQASNDLSIATFPWLDEFVVNPSSPIEALLSNSPKTCSFKDSNLIGYFSKGYFILYYSLQSDVSSSIKNYAYKVNGDMFFFHFADKAALMLSSEAARYIIRISPCTGALLSILNKGNDLSAPFDKKRLRGAIFPLRLWIPIISVWIHVKTSALALKRSRSLPLK